MSKAYGPLIRHGLRRGLASKAGFSLSRRDALRFGAAGVAAALLPGLGCRKDGARGGKAGASSGGVTKPVKKVVVVGAGFSGLACADTLAKAGVDVTVYEATGRAGGRVLTDRKMIDGDPVELGGEWIGSNHPTWLAYAKELNLELEEPGAEPEAGADEAAAGEGGDARKAADIQRGEDAVNKPDEPDAPEGDKGENGEKKGEVPAEGEEEPDEPIILGGKLIRGEEADKLFEEVDGVLADLIEMARAVDPVRPWTSPDAAALDGRSFADYVAKTNLSETARTLILTSEEADNGVAAGKMSLLGYLSMVAGGGFKDYYENSEVYRLAGGNDALASALAKKLEGRVKFGHAVTSIQRTGSGATVRTSKGETAECDAVVVAVPPSVWDRLGFEPKLDAKLTPQMGRNVKLILTVKKPVWEDEGLSEEVVSDGLVGLTWVATDGKPDAPIAFTLFSGAAAADKLRELDSKDRARQAIASLKPAYPGLGDATTADRFVDWPGMPLVRASYSFPAPGQVTAFGPTLVDGVSDGLAPLRFAGEHTAYGFIGYMEGALSSGVRTARALVGAKDAAAT